MIRYLHTGDWQLGITRHFFSEGVQERFAQSPSIYFQKVVIKLMRIPFELRIFDI